MIENAKLQDLVSPTRVHPRVYTDPEIFELELSRLFGRAWLFVAHESQLQHAGDFVRTPMGRFEVLVTRDASGALHVVRNSCAHRGARLCTEQRGNRERLVCPYHAWTYRADGSLASVPHRRSYPESFDLDDASNWLLRAPRVDSYRGFVFASWAPQGSSLTDYLHPLTSAFDNLIDRAPHGVIEPAGGQFLLHYPGNWKLHMENANDTLHPSFVHASSVASGRAQADASDGSDGGQTKKMIAANGFTQREWDHVELHGFANGHSYMGGFYKSGLISASTADPVTQAYRGRLAERVGEDNAERILSVDRFNNLIYPNLSINAQFHQLRIVHPLAVDRTLVQAFCFRLAGAPPAIFQRAVRFLNVLSSPASMIFGDDVEIFGRCQAGMANQGVDSINLQRGTADDTVAADGARRSPGASELPSRVQFQAWLRFMTEQSQ